MGVTNGESFSYIVVKNSNLEEYEDHVIVKDKITGTELFVDTGDEFTIKISNSTPDISLTGYSFDLSLIVFLGTIVAQSYNIKLKDTPLSGIVFVISFGLML